MLPPPAAGKFAHLLLQSFPVSHFVRAETLLSGRASGLQCFWALMSQAWISEIIKGPRCLLKEQGMGFLPVMSDTGFQEKAVAP